MELTGEHADSGNGVAAPQATSDVFTAAAEGDLDRIRELVVNEPAVVEAWSAEGFTALHLAADHGHEEIVETLLRHGAAIEAASRNELEVRPLGSAAARDHRSIVSLLLTYGADPNARQRGGWTPLHAAARAGDAELARLLLEAHAEPGLAADDGTTALDVARTSGHEGVVELLANWTPGPAE